MPVPALPPAILICLFASLAGLIYLLVSPRFAERFYHPLLFEPLKYPGGNYPPEGETREPATFTDVFFDNGSGKKLHGWHFPAPGSSGNRTVLVCHGNAGNISDMTVLVKLLRATGAGVFVFDYQGFGKSEGSPSVRGICQDAIAALKHLSATTDPSTIVLYGESLGAAVACQLASQFTVGGLILQSGFSNVRKIGYEQFPPLFVFPELLFPRPFFDNLAVVKTYEQGPVLFIHGEKDREITIAHAELMYACAREPKHLVRLANTAHEEIGALDHDRFVSEIAAYLERLENRLPSKGFQPQLG